MYTLKSPRWGDSKEYTQHAFSWSNKITSKKYPYIFVSCTLWIISYGLKNEFESVIAHKPLVFLLYVQNKKNCGGSW